jgi:hypothetical protein
MIEPRASIHFLHTDSIEPEGYQALSDSEDEPLLASFPSLHPGLEFEEASHVSNGSSISSKNNPLKDVRLVLSVLFLTLAGAGNTVLAKLEAISLCKSIGHRPSSQSCKHVQRTSSISTASFLTISLYV